MIKIFLPLRDSKNLVFAHIAQVVEHFLGKEEVTGSTPVMSSKVIIIFIFRKKKWLKKNLRGLNLMST